MDHTICHFEIPSDDLKRAGAFYKELFGWEMQPWSPDGGEANIWMVKTVPSDEQGRPIRPGVNGMLIKKMHPQHPFANYIHVESVADYAAKAAALGGEIALPKTPVPGMGYFAYIKDTEGNIIGLWELDPTAGAA
jgi:uncharacterized protein